MDERFGKPEKAGDPIPVASIAAAAAAGTNAPADALLRPVGMSGRSAKTDLRDNDAAGRGMWLARPDEDGTVWIAFDFGATYPVGEMWVWNYNQHHPACPGLHLRGLKEVRIAHSLDGVQWTELTGEGHPYRLAAADGRPGLAATNLDGPYRRPIAFGNALARYVRIAADAVAGVGNWGGCDGQEALFGLACVRFYAGTGYAAEPAGAWTALFHRTRDWSGSDGIYSAAFNASEKPGTAAGTRTLFVFGDTFVGAVDEATDRRLPNVMINNSMAVLEGGEPKPEALQFLWTRSGEGEAGSMFVPATERGKQVEGAYYWLQDCVVIGGRMHAFPMIIGPNPEGPEGFQFAVHGVCRISVPIGASGPRFELQQQTDTPLYFTAANGRTTYFGAAVMPNTEEAGTPDPDGYVYVYGLQTGDGTKLVAARVTAEAFEDFGEWRFWDGLDWTPAKEQAAPIADEISSEFSVTPMAGGWGGRPYVVVFQESGTGNRLSLYAGDSPVGPFADPVRLHHCPESGEGKSIYTYNAKAHPHLSAPGELLASYNVNTASWDMHMMHASIYRPRFVNIRRIAPPEEA